MLGYTRRGAKNELVLFGIDDFVSKFDYISGTYRNVMLALLTKEELDLVKEMSKEKGFDIFKEYNYITSVKHLDHEFFEMRGKKYENYRRFYNMHDKRNFDVYDTCQDMDELVAFLKKWEKLKKQDMMFTFVNDDINFFFNFYKDLKKTADLISLFFYDKGTLVGFNIVERLKDEFYICHIRKSDRWNYMNLNFYIDILTFKKIYRRNGNQEFLFELGEELGKLTDYKVGKFKTFTTTHNYKVKLKMSDNKSTVVLPLF